MNRELDLRNGASVAGVCLLGVALGFLIGSNPWVKLAAGRVIAPTARAAQVTTRTRRVFPGVARRGVAGADDRAIDWSKDIQTYNCAGFAFRNYKFMTLDEVRSALVRMHEMKSPAERCPPGALKVWAWEYDVHHETADGWVEEAHRDGHVVAGLTDPVTGMGPREVYCKFGRGPVVGPGDPEQFRPPEREEVGTNNMGVKVFVVRERFNEKWYWAMQSEMPK